MDPRVQTQYRCLKAEWSFPRVQVRIQILERLEPGLKHAGMTE